MKNESELTPENIANPQRRTIIKAAAWAAPVVAIAATAPLAAASIHNPGTQLGVYAGSLIQNTGGNIPGGTIHGQFNGYGTITNVGPAWTINKIEADYRIQGGGYTDASLTFDGTSLPAVGQTIEFGGNLWQVTRRQATRITLQLTTTVNVPADGNVQIFVPTLAYYAELTDTVGDGDIETLLTVRVETPVGDTLSGIGGNSFT